MGGTFWSPWSLCLFLSLSLSLSLSLPLSLSLCHWINCPELPGLVWCGGIRSSLKGLEQFGTPKPKCCGLDGWISLTSSASRSPDSDNNKNRKPIPTLSDSIRPWSS